MAPLLLLGFNRPKAISGLATSEPYIRLKRLLYVSIARRRLVVLRPGPVEALVKLNEEFQSPEGD